MYSFMAEGNLSEEISCEGAAIKYSGDLALFIN